MDKNKILDLLKIIPKKQEMCEICHVRKATKSKLSFGGDREVKLCSRCYDMVKF